MLQFIHVIQHLRWEILGVSLLRVHWDLGLDLVSIFACHNLRHDFLVSLWACLRSVVDVVHLPIVDVIAILHSEPRVLFYLLIMLFWLEVDYIEFRHLLVVYPSLVHHQTPLAVIGKIWWYLVLFFNDGIVLLHLLISVGILDLLRTIWLDGSWYFTAGSILLIVAVDVISMRVLLWEIGSVIKWHRILNIWRFAR
jgi:hypothetical protein